MTVVWSIHAGGASVRADCHPGELIMKRLQVLVLLVLVSAGTFSARGEITPWFAPAATKVLRNSTPQVPGQGYSLSAARNETEACQLVLWSDRPARGVVVRVSDLRRTNGSESLTPALYKVEYVPDIVGKTPYPDPLPPLKPLDFEANQAQPVWISVRVPASAKPGDYTATVRVETGGSQQELSLKLHVWDFALPATPSAATAFGIDDVSIARQHGVSPGSAAAKALYARYYEMLLDHRISAYTIPVDLMSDEAPRYLKDPRLTSYMIPYPSSDDELQRLVNRLVRFDCYEKGYFYPIDEPVKKGAYDQLEQISRRLHSVTPGYRWVVPFYTRPDWDKNLSAFDLMTGRVTIWCPNLHYFDLEPKTRPTLAARKKAGERIWWYVCCGPGEPYNNFFVQMSAMAHRALFWQQKRENVEGLLYWSTTYWNPASTVNPWTSMMTVKDINPAIRGDGSLFYPGKPLGIDGPVSSLRLEVIRDGLEDFDYLTLADRFLGKERTDHFVNQVARTLRDYTHDPVALEKVRQELGDALEKAVNARGLKRISAPTDADTLRPPGPEPGKTYRVSFDSLSSSATVGGLILVREGLLETVGASELLLFEAHEPTDAEAQPTCSGSLTS